MDWEKLRRHMRKDGIAVVIVMKMTEGREGGKSKSYCNRQLCCPTGYL